MSRKSYFVVGSDGSAGAVEGQYANCFPDIGVRYDEHCRMHRLFHFGELGLATATMSDFPVEHMS